MGNVINFRRLIFNITPTAYCHIALSNIGEGGLLSIDSDYQLTR
jgi:hypothetical protein